MCKSPDYSYSGEVTISPEITVNDTKYSVTAIAENAFSRCRGLATVQIPSSVTSVGRNAFAYCPDLRNILFESGMPPTTQRNHIMPGASGSVCVYAPASGYDDYAALFGSYHPVFARIESIESQSVTLSELSGVIDVAISPVHPSIDTEFIIEPLDDTATEMDITSVEVVNGALRIGVNASCSGTARYTIASRQPGVTPATLSVTFNVMSSQAQLEADTAPEMLFDLQGRPSTSRRGYRIVVSEGRARLIRF